MANETSTPADQAIVLRIPAPGQTVVMDVQPNQVIEVPFDMAEANVTLTGTDLRIEFPGNAVIILSNFVAMVDQGASPVMMFADGSVMAGDVLLTALTAELPETAAGPTAGSGGAGEYEDDMGDLIGTIDRLGTQNPDPFAKSVAVQVLDEDLALPAQAVPPPQLNQPPVAEDNVYRVTVGQLRSILEHEGLLSNDSDPDGDQIAITSTAPPSNVTIDPVNGALTIDATTAAELYAAYQALDEGETVQVTFPYTISDPSGASATANVTIIVEGINDPPTIVTDGGNPTGAADIVYEAGLLPDGSGLGPTTAIAEGTITIGDPDGLDDIRSITLAGILMTIGTGPGEFASLADMVGQTFTGTYGTLELTAYLDGTFAYRYTLTTPATDLAGPEYDEFAVVVADETASAGASITIEIVDDVPTAVDDLPVILTEDALVDTVSGNVLSNDRSGADIPKVFVAWDDNGAAVTELSKYGTLTLDADGSYAFTLNNAAPLVQALAPADIISQSLVYTMRDADGDERQATLTITINGAEDMARVTVAAEGADSTVYEAGLDPDGSDAAAASETDADTFEVQATDGIATVVIGGATFTLDELKGFTPTSPSVGIPTGEGTLVLTGYSSSDGDRTATLSYRYTLDAAQAHPIAGNDLLTDSVPLEVHGIGGTTATADLNIAIVDDVPSAGISEPVLLAIGAGNSLTADLNITFGADGPGSGAAVQVIGPTTDGFVVDNDGNFLTAGGVRLVYLSDGDGGLAAVKETNHDFTAFTVDVDAATDSYTVTIVDGLDGLPVPILVNLASFRSIGGGVTPMFTFDVNLDDDVAAEAVFVTTAVGDSNIINYNNNALGVGNGAKINNGDHMWMEYRALTESGDIGDLKIIHQATFEAWHLSGGEKVYYKVYAGGVEGELVGAGDFTGTGNPSGFETFTINVGSAFDTIEFYGVGSGGYGYGINNLTIYEQGELDGTDYQITYNFTAIDGDLDTAAGSFDVTFDGTPDPEILTESQIFDDGGDTGDTPPATDLGMFDSDGLNSLTDPGSSSNGNPDQPAI